MARHNEQFQVKSKKKVYLQVLVSNKVGKELSRIKSDFRKALVKPGDTKLKKKNIGIDCYVTRRIMNVGKTE